MTINRFNLVSAYIHNQTEEEWLKLVENIGSTLPVRLEPLTPQDLRDGTDKDGDFTTILAIDFEELACVSDDGTIEGLNEWVDDHLFANLGGVGSDYRFRPLAVNNGEILFEFTCEVSDLLGELEENDEI